MAVESPILAQDNFFVDEDKLLRFYVTTGEPIRVAITAQIGDTVLYTAPLKEQVGTGAVLRFGGMLITASGTSEIGATSIAITAATGVVPGETIGYKVQDITDWTMEFKLLPFSGSTTALLTIAGAIANALQGIATVTFADTDTSSPAPGLAPKSYYYTFRRTNAGSEGVIAFGAFVLRG